MNSSIPKKSAQGRMRLRGKRGVRRYGDHKNPPKVRKAAA